MREFLVFQFDNDTTMQDAVVENEVWIVVFIVNDDTLLARLKAEPFAKFKDEVLQMTDESILQIVFIDNILSFES